MHNLSYIDSGKRKKKSKRSKSRTKKYRSKKKSPLALGLCAGKSRDKCKNDPNCEVTSVGCRRRKNIKSLTYSPLSSSMSEQDFKEIYTLPKEGNILDIDYGRRKHSKSHRRKGSKTLRRKSSKTRRRRGSKSRKRKSSKTRMSKRF